MSALGPVTCVPRGWSPYLPIPDSISSTIRLGVQRDAVAFAVPVHRAVTVRADRIPDSLNARKIEERVDQTSARSPAAH